MATLLTMLQQAQGYLSGEKIGETLGISRGGVWKQIKKLREQGYEIESVPNRGYRLMEQAELWNGEEIKAGLQTKTLGQEVVFLEEVSSTNERLAKLAREGKKEGLLVVAQQQTAGRGRRGKSWTSPKGTGIWMSLLLRPNLPPVKAPMLTLLAGLAVCKSIGRVTGLPAAIKWPNDVLIHGKKVCGILTEMDGEMEQIHHIVLGIGINVNTESFPEELKEIATSLFLEKGELVSRKQLLQEILKEWEGIYTQYEAQGDFSAFQQEYLSLCQTIGGEITVLGKEPFDGIGVDITQQGELVVEKTDGTRVVVYSGEVSIRRRK